MCGSENVNFRLDDIEGLLCFCLLKLFMFPGYVSYMTMKGSFGLPSTQGPGLELFKIFFLVKVHITKLYI